MPRSTIGCPLCRVPGSNGRQYRFLLKGHEDLRQDERVMQLFGLVNTLLSNNPETSKRDLLIGCVVGVK
jgi:FKBP12-rapamycin complex-associated protein